MMVGRELAAVFPKRASAARRRRAGGARTSRTARVGVRDVSLPVARGEILGLAGLVGSGRTELAETLFGLRPADRRRDPAARSRSRIGSPPERSPAGIAYVPEDRRQHGVVLEMSVAANVTLASLASVSRRGIDRPTLPSERRRRELRRSPARQDAVGRRRVERAVRRQPAEGRAGALARDEARAC